MALTPEDVLNKTFTQTQFRRGYDEREVDDFLDEVVAEMRRMVKDGEDLRARVQDGDAPATTSAAAAPAPAGDSGQAVKERDALMRRNDELKARLEKEQSALADAQKRASEAEARVKALEEQQGRESQSRDEQAAAAKRGADERVSTVTARAEANN